MDPDWACWEWAVGVLGYTGLKLEQMFHSWSSKQEREDSENKIKEDHKVKLEKLIN